MSKLLLIARMDDTGLGNQTRALAYMLKPARILVIDSTPFNGNKQHPEWYEDFEHIVVKGFPSDRHMLVALQDMTHVLTCEIAYNYNIFKYARARGVKTFLQANYEFLDYANTPRLPLPDTFLMPSYWHLDTMKAKYPNVEYLPPPTFLNDFTEAANVNTDRRGRRRFVHIVGKPAIYDRNGTQDLLAALYSTTSDFELVIKCQSQTDQYHTADSRVTYDFRNVAEPQELYRDYDALIMPRRYGGLCMVANEALASALPVIMSNVSPNNQQLPQEWLTQTLGSTTFAAKTIVEAHHNIPVSIAQKIDWLCSMSDDEMSNMRAQALEIGHNYSSGVLKPEYERIMEL